MCRQGWHAHAIPATVSAVLGKGGAKGLHSISSLVEAGDAVHSLLWLFLSWLKLTHFQPCKCGDIYAAKVPQLKVLLSAG